MFCKRNYEAIALVMQEAHPGACDFIENNRAVIQWNDAVKGTGAADLQRDGLFKYERFVRACQPGDDVRARRKEPADVHCRHCATRTCTAKSRPANATAPK